MQRASKVDVLACDCVARLRFIGRYCERRKIDEVLRSLGISDSESQASQERAPPKPPVPASVFSSRPPVGTLDPLTGPCAGPPGMTTRITTKSLVFSKIANKNPDSC